MALPVNSNYVMANYLKLLNLDPDVTPSTSELKKSYEELCLAHRKRAEDPVTPLDWNSKRIYEKAKNAYDYLLKELESSASYQHTKTYRVGLKEYLRLHVSNSPFLVESRFTEPCYCKRECSSCHAGNTPCGTCNGNGWTHYCNSCQGTGTVQKKKSISLPLEGFNKSHQWSLEEQLINLEIKPEEGYYFENSNLAIDVSLDAQKVTQSKFNYVIDLNLGSFFNKSLTLKGLQNFCKPHVINLVSDYPHLPFGTITVKPNFNSR